MLQFSVLKTVNADFIIFIDSTKICEILHF